MNVNKVIEINIEADFDTVEVALRKMINHLGTCKRLGYKAVILIHGYGSSGVGGSIKTAVRKKLADSSMRGIVALSAAGEEWFSKRREALSMCKSLEMYERRIANNEGVTVLILKK